MMTDDLEAANRRIERLEAYVKELEKELDFYRNKKESGRKRHNEKWMEGYHEFVIYYENGSTVIEIAKKQGVSERTAYRYLDFYRKQLLAKDNEEKQE